MARYRRKRVKKTAPLEKTKKQQTKAAEYVGYLLELHELQGALLHHLDKEVT